MQSIIGIDIGTTNCKAVAFSKDGKVIATANASYNPITEKRGYHELRLTDVLNAVTFVIKQIIVEAKFSSEIKGICFSAAMHSLIAVDKSGVPLTNMMTWADLRSAGEAAQIKNSKTGIEIYERCGTPIHAMTPLCKILWLKNNEPEIFERTQKFIGIKEYLWLQFFGKYQVDYSIASSTGIFDIYEHRWNETSLKIAGIEPEKLSEPVEPTHIETALIKKYREECQADGIPFIIGSSDGCLANLGSNAIGEGETSLTIGTSGALRMASAKPNADPQQRIFNYILEKNLYISGGATNNGGAVVQWYADNFFSQLPTTEKSFSEKIELIDEVAAGCEGLIFLPYLFGERAPIWDANAKAVFFGINPNHRPKDFLRAVVEGISFSMFQIGVSLEETIGPVNKIYASGGFIHSKTWVQIIADVFDKEVELLNVADASAIGASIMGMKAIGLIKANDEMTSFFRVTEKFSPIKANNKIYKETIKKFSALYNKMKDEF